ncbi:serine/threonine-protein kinase [Nocardioides montaniterrae]
MAGPPVSGVRWSGDRLGPYRIERCLGVGGMGTVYEATEDVLDRRVALKLIKPEHARNPDFRMRFTAEAQAQASLDSAHVAKVFAHGEVEGELFIATQLAPDGDLARRLASGPPPLSTALEIVAQVADGLTEAHRIGLVHRDIKPSNVLLRNRGDGWTAYLADFGIAHRAGAPISLTERLAGTPAYLAPELYDGVPPGPASDAYALGCLLYAALTGLPPQPAAGVPRLKGRGRPTKELNALLAAVLTPDPRVRVTVATVRDALRRATRR